MPRVRLTGLFLFITALMLGLAAAATRTSHLRFKQFVSSDISQSSNSVPEDSESTPLQFTTVPIFYPLAAVAAVGLLLWFAPSAIMPRSQYQQKSYGRGRRNSLLGWLGSSPKKRR